MPIVPWKRSAGRQMHCATWTPVSLRNTTVYWVSGLPRHRGIQRGRQTVPTEIDVTGDDLPAPPVRRGLSQPAKPARESSVQIRLASLAKNCGDRMHDPPGSRARCLSSVHCVRTAQCRGALGERSSARWPLPAPALLDEFRWQSDPVPWSGSLGRADSPCSGRTDSCTTEIQIAGNCVGKRRQNVTGRDALTKGPPLCRAKHQWTLHQSDTHPSPRCAHIIRARSILATSSNDREKKEEPPGHTGRATRRPQTRSPLSRSSHPKWRWTRESSLLVPTSVSPVTHCHWPLPVQWSRAQPAMPAGTGSSFEVLRAQSWRSNPSKKLPPTLGAPCASISAEESASRRGGLVGTRRLDAFVSLRRQDQLDTVSGNGRRVIAKQHLDLVSPSVSRVRAPASCACEWSNCGVPGKESTWRRPKDPKPDQSRHRLISKSVDSLPDRSV